MIFVRATGCCRKVIPTLLSFLGEAVFFSSLSIDGFVNEMLQHRV